MKDLFPENASESLQALENTAIERLRYWHDMDMLDGKPYWVGFSGGKDSTVLKEIVKKAGVPAEFHYSITTIDPPELIYFIRKFHTDVIWDRCKKGAFLTQLPKRGLPTRIGRWCCGDYKESGPSSKGRWVVLGIRSCESPRRKAQRQHIQQCFKESTKTLVHPILEWTDDDIWAYIHKYSLPYCKLYDEGWKRLGCIGCPLATDKMRDKEFARWPRYDLLYRRATNKLYDRNKELGKSWTELFKDGDALYDAWRGWIPWPKNKIITDLIDGAW